MSIDSTREYLQVMQTGYATASRKERSRLLDEMVRATGLNRKYLIQLMKGDLERKPRRRQRGRIYGPEVEAAVLFIAECQDFICGKRLQPALLFTARNLARHGEMTLSPLLEESLAKISASTIDRMLARNRHQVEKRLPRKAPTRPSGVLRSVPMLKIPWDEQEPGHLEADLVYHCGSDTSGDFVYTLQAIDVATGWSARYAILGKSGWVMEDAFSVLRHRLPFPIKEIHTDNGSEFLNAHMLRFWPKLVPGICLSRNRPWSKNDSRFVEQKNFTLVRAYLGYKRYDTVAQTWAINYLYELLNLYNNLFQPVMRLKEKIWIHQDGQRPKLKRIYDEPRTPLARLCATNALSEDQRDTIYQLRDAINIRWLRQEIVDLLAHIRAMPNAAPDQVQSVVYTLSNYRPHIKKGEWQPRLAFHLTQPLPFTLTNKTSPG